MGGGQPGYWEAISSLSQPDSRGDLRSDWSWKPRKMQVANLENLGHGASQIHPFRHSCHSSKVQEVQPLAVELIPADPVEKHRRLVAPGGGLSRVLACSAVSALSTVVTVREGGNGGLSLPCPALLTALSSLNRGIRPGLHSSAASPGRFQE